MKYRIVAFTSPVSRVLINTLNLTPVNHGRTKSSQNPPFISFFSKVLSHIFWSSSTIFFQRNVLSLLLYVHVLFNQTLYNFLPQSNVQEKCLYKHPPLLLFTVSASLYFFISPKSVPNFPLTEGLVIYFPFLPFLCGYQSFGYSH